MNDLFSEAPKYTSEFWMVIRGLFSHTPFEKKRQLWPFRIPVWIPMPISGIPLYQKEYSSSPVRDSYTQFVTQYNPLPQKWNWYRNLSFRQRAVLSHELCTWDSNRQRAVFLFVKRNTTDNELVPPDFLNAAVKWKYLHCDRIHS